MQKPEENILQVRCLLEGSFMANRLGSSETRTGSILMVQSLAKQFFKKLIYIILMTLLVATAMSAREEKIQTNFLCR